MWFILVPMLKNAFIIGGARKDVGQIKPWLNVKKTLMLEAYIVQALIK